jgi:hypothetical protein
MKDANPDLPVPLPDAACCFAVESRLGSWMISILSAIQDAMPK